MNRGIPLLAVGVAAAVGSVMAWNQPNETPPFERQQASANGRNLFLSKGCAACHEGPGVASLTGTGPPLTEASTSAGTRRPGLSATDYLAESIRNPGAFTSPLAGSGAVMPTLTVDDREVDALVRFLLQG